MTVTATPPRSSRRPQSSAPPSPYADRDAGGCDSPLRRSRGFATNLSACAGDEGAPSADSPTFHVRKSERISQWRSGVSPSAHTHTHTHTPRRSAAALGHGGSLPVSPYTPKTHSALARAMIDSSDESDDGEPPARPRQARQHAHAQLQSQSQLQQRTPPASSRKLGSAFNMAGMSPLSQASPAPPAKVRFLAEPMRRYNSLPTPPAAWSPSRVPRSIGLYDLNLHATPPKSKYQPKKLDLGGPLPGQARTPHEGPLTPAPEIEEDR